MRKYLTAAALVLAVLGACKKEPIKPIEVESIDFRFSSTEIILGDSTQLEIFVLPENAINQEITWVASDATVAKVENGVVKAISLGETTITASVANGVTASTQIKVVQDIEGITADKEALISIYEANNGVNWYENLNWKSSKPLNEWYGVTTNSQGRVIGLRFVHNNLTGDFIPSALTELIHLNCSENNLDNLDVTKNAKLKELRIDKNNITSIDLTKNVELAILHCNSMNIEELDLGSTSKLIELSSYNNRTIKRITINYNSLLSLSVDGWGAKDVDKYTAPNYIDGYQYPHITISGADAALESDIAADKAALLAMYNSPLFNKEEWTDANWDENTPLSQWDGIELNHFGRVKKIDLSFAGVEGEIHLSNLPTLLEFHCTFNSISKINITNLPLLKELHCVNNSLRTLDVSEFTTLEILSCSANDLSALDVSMLTNLEELDCAYNELTHITVSDLPKLERIDCSYNKLEIVNISNLPMLDDFICTHNNNILAYIGLLNLPVLENINCSYNNFLQGIAMVNLPSLKFINCSENHSLREIDVSGLAELISLNLYNNINLQSIDLSSNKKLKSLDVTYNALKSIDVTNNTELTHLYFAYIYKMANVDLTKNIALEKIDCRSTAIVTLDLSKSNRLQDVKCGPHLETSAIPVAFRKTLLSVILPKGFKLGFGDEIHTWEKDGKTYPVVTTAS